LRLTYYMCSVWLSEWRTTVAYSTWERSRRLLSVYFRNLLLGSNGVAKETEHGIIGVEAPTAPVIKVSVFWDITPCSWLKVKLRFGNISSPSSGPKNNLRRNQSKAGSKQRQLPASHWFLLGLFFTLKMDAVCRVMSVSCALLNCTEVAWYTYQFTCLSVQIFK
jgi:hypothetical protein